MFCVCLCARFQACLKESHLIALKRIFRYLFGTQNLGLWYPKKSSLEIIGFSYADYAGSKTDRKSTSGHVNFLVICLCLGLAKTKILLLFLLLKLSILLLVVVLKSYGLNNNWVILVLLCIIFLSFVIRILFNTHAPSILRLCITLLDIMYLNVTFALNMLILLTNLLIYLPNPWMKINFARLEENLAWLMLMMSKH